jgi:hypothetical protein
MSRAFDRVDKETLKRDDQLVEVLKKIKEKVLSGHIVELKTLTNQSSEVILYVKIDRSNIRETT